MVEHEYLLDTNVCIAILKNNLEVFKRVLAVGQSHCHISEITIAELFYGAAKSGKRLISMISLRLLVCLMSFQCIQVSGGMVLLRQP
ncbi:MAG: PIN domain-containing protein [Prevotella sp.]|nr:PIN domain-containing protein [Prevotella sp.]